jgi:hypothetical protein
MGVSISYALLPDHDPAGPAMMFVMFSLVALMCFGPFVFVTNLLLATRSGRDGGRVLTASVLLILLLVIATFGGYAVLLVKRWPLSPMPLSNSWVFAIGAVSVAASFSAPIAWVVADHRIGLR